MAFYSFLISQRAIHSQSMPHLFLFPSRGGPSGRAPLRAGQRKKEPLL